MRGRRLASMAKRFHTFMFLKIVAMALELGAHEE